MAPRVGVVQTRGVRLSLQAQYAICGMFDLAYNGAGEPIQVRVIGERQRIPARYLEQIFQRLRRARLVTGKRGPGGGYVLARSPSEISLRDVVEAVEGPLDGDLAGGPPPRDEAVPFRPHFLWREVAGSLAETLERIDLEGLCREAARSAVPRAHPDSHMYFI